MAQGFRSTRKRTNGVEGRVELVGAKVWKGSEILVRDLVPVIGLRADEANARKRTPRNIEAIRASFSRFGQVRPILTFEFEKGVRTVISGNGGFLVAQQMGWTHLAAIPFSGSKSEARAYAIADNRAGEFSEWDLKVLEAGAAAMRADDSLADLYASLRIPDLLKRSGGEGTFKPELEFSIELLEESNYVVFLFGNELDWRVVEQAFGLKPVYSLKSRPGFEQAGVGRIIPGKKLLDLLALARQATPAQRVAAADSRRGRSR